MQEKTGIAPFQSVINLITSIKEADKKAMEDGVRNTGDIGTYIQYTFPQIISTIGNISQFDESWNDLDYDEIVTDLANEAEEKLGLDQDDLVLVVGALLMSRGAHLKFFTKKETENV